MPEPGELIGETLDQMGVRAELEDGEMIVDAVVLLKIVRTDRDGAFVYVAAPEGQDWIQQEGLMAAARRKLDADALDL